MSFDRKLYENMDLIMGATLYQKVFDSHVVADLGSNRYQLFMGLHLIHEVTTPQAFAMLKERGLSVLFPQRTFATIDHIVPTASQARPFLDVLAEDMASALEQNVREHGIQYFSPENGESGIVHVIGPQFGLTQPGMTICCGDSHTSTHGAFGSIAFGIGTSQVRDVLATQTLAMSKLKVRRIRVEGSLGSGVYAKDVILKIIQQTGAKGGVGYAYEYAGSLIEGLSMDERMTICNMSIEGGARCGYVNPDETTYKYLSGRRYAPSGAAWERALKYWQSVRSDEDAVYDDEIVIDGSDLAPMVTWGISLDQSVAVDGLIPHPVSVHPDEQRGYQEALEYMDLKAGQPIAGYPVDVAFLGSCTNGRLSDFELVARLIKDNGVRVNPRVKALAVPGSAEVKEQMLALGIDAILRDAGFEVREAGCSMCLAMNPDKLEGRQVCASSSNRNFKGRQGSPVGRTLIMSPAAVLAAAVEGAVADPRAIFTAVS